jgi:methanogenic corrinoid protein MtbC1
LTHTLELDIIPRLVLARRTIADRGPAAEPGARPEAVAELTNLLLAGDPTLAIAQLEALHCQGATMEILYLDLMAPAARRLGQLWESDTVSFAEVTIGLGRLQQAIRTLSHTFADRPAPCSPSRHALLMPAPGEQHTFGLLMVAEFFRRAGWDVFCEPSYPGSAAIGLVRRESFAVIGYSVSRNDALDALAAQIRLVRQASCNRAIVVMVGGKIFADHPELVAHVGADTTAVDGRQAAQRAQHSISALEGRR